MEIKDVIYSRRSVRNYSEKAVDKAAIESLIDAAIQAPSAMNSQPWAFGVVQDKELLRKVSDRAKEEFLRVANVGEYRETLENPEFNIFYNVTTLIIIFARPNVSPMAGTDCSLAAENLMLMAKNLGLGTCWIGFSIPFLSNPEGKQMLGIPEDYSVVAPIIVGYPAEEPEAREKNPPEIVFWRNG